MGGTLLPFISSLIDIKGNMAQREEVIVLVKFPYLCEQICTKESRYSVYLYFFKHILINYIIRSRLNLIECINYCNSLHIR